MTSLIDDFFFYKEYLFIKSKLIEFVIYFRFVFLIIYELFDKFNFFCEEKCRKN